MLSLPGAAEIVHGRWTTSKPLLCSESPLPWAPEIYRFLCSFLPHRRRPPSFHLLSNNVLARAMPPILSYWRHRGRLEGKVLISSQAAAPASPPRSQACLRVDLFRLHLSQLFLFWILNELGLGAIYLSLKS